MSWGSRIKGVTDWPQIALTLVCLLFQVLSSLGSSSEQAHSCVRRPKQEVEEPSRRHRLHSTREESWDQPFSESGLSSLKGARGDQNSGGRERPLEGGPYCGRIRLTTLEPHFLPLTFLAPCFCPWRKRKTRRP